MTDYEFPFFGAGHARYFEYAVLSVRFRRKLTPAQRDGVSALAPPAFVGGLGFKGQFLSVGSPDYVHLAISAYEADAGEEDDLDGRPIFAAESKVRRFNEAIERWLVAAHAIAPIAVAVRPEDGEAGGTELSDWHRWSLGRLPDVLEGFEDLLAKKRRRSPATETLEEVLVFAEEGGVAIPDAVLQWWRPQIALTGLLRTGEPHRVAAALSRLGDEAEDVLSDAVASIDLESTSDRTALLALADVVGKFEAGWATTVGAAALEASDPATDARLASLARAGAPFRHGAGDAFLRAARSRPAAVSRRVRAAGAHCVPEADFLLGTYLSDVVAQRAFAEVDRVLLDRAAARCDGNPWLLLNVTNITYELGEPESGIAVVDRYEAGQALPDAALLNAGLLHACAGNAARARAYAARSAQSGDAGAAMIEPMVLVAQGDHDGALAALRRIAESGYERFGAWKDDLGFAALRESAAYQALFR